MIAHNRYSEQSRAGMPDEGLGVAAIGLEHFKAAVAGHVGDLDQVGAALHRGGHEASAQAVAGKGRSFEPELDGGSLDDGRDIAGREAPATACRSRCGYTPISCERSTSGAKSRKAARSRAPKLSVSSLGWRCCS